ncbi:hypothetical protein LZ554_003357 [Drepanopeziza brunnea f. sp. 'monogermtubi']|nr:hypothetical protein LZ554_003357 [Drepanopeziza brunnea f. sp. 'monogermtubi']
MASGYDFTPFLEAKAVEDTQRAFGRPQIIPIPATNTVSPLAPDISPNTVRDLKEFLLGSGSGTGPKGQKHGRELWEAWKRAWDLWNNHYIEGRESPVWIRAEYERIKKEMVHAQDERRRKAFLRRRRPGSRPRAKRKLGNIVWAKDRPAPTAHGKIFMKTGKSKIEIAKEIIKRPNPGREFRDLRKGEEAPVYGSQAVPMEIVEMERIVRKDGAPVSGWARVTNDRKSSKALQRKDETAELESTHTEVERTYMARQVMQFTNSDITGDQYDKTVGEFKLLTYDESIRIRADGKQQPTKNEAMALNDKVQRPQLWVPVMEPSFLDKTVILDKDARISLLTFRDEEIDVLEKQYEWKEVDGESQLDIDFDGDRMMTDDLVDKDAGHVHPPSSDEDDREPVISIPLPHRVIYGNNESGGFQPMKDLPEYAPPIPTDDGDDDEWIDAIDNTVWRPRGTGEKRVKIDIDECFDDSVDTALETYGGVDCGRSPYPVLRSVTKYIQQRTPQGEIQYFRKKKTWDGVTGTIFNMPNKPIEKDDTEDERVEAIKGMYADELRDGCSNYQGNKADIFPLDIRRIRRCKAPEPTIPLLDGQEQVFELPWLNAPESSDTLDEYDPWRVTPEQKRLRDNPLRKYPPKEFCEPTKEDELILPVEEDIWEEDLKADDYGYYKYFVTNLHGGTLIINGIQVPKGRIAGPLPAFAVIETPGAQFSFWWGSSGRSNGRAATVDHNLHSKWETFRQRHSADGDDMKYIGLLAGQVWDYKIRNWVKGELEGETYKEGPIWEAYKKAVPAAEQPHEAPYKVEETAVVLKKDEKGIPVLTDIKQPECFESAIEEVKWLRTKAVPLLESIAQATSNPFVVPNGDDFWKSELSATEDQDPCPEITLQNDHWSSWIDNERRMIHQQEVAIHRANDARDQRDIAQYNEDVALGAKRKAAADLDTPYPKRTFQSLQQQAAALIKAQADAAAAEITKEQKAKDDTTLRLKVLEFNADVQRKIKAAKAHNQADIDDIIEKYCAEQEARATRLINQLKKINSTLSVPKANEVRDTYAAWKAQDKPNDRDNVRRENPPDPDGRNAQTLSEELKRRQEEAKKVADATQKQADEAAADEKKADKDKGEKMQKDLELQKRYEHAELRRQQKKRDDAEKKRLDDVQGQIQQNIAAAAERRRENDLQQLRQRQQQQQQLQQEQQQKLQPPPPPPPAPVLTAEQRQAAMDAANLRRVQSELDPPPNFTRESIQAFMGGPLTKDELETAYVANVSEWMTEVPKVKANLESRASAAGQNTWQYLVAQGYSSRAKWISDSIDGTMKRLGGDSGHTIANPPPPDPAGTEDRAAPALERKKGTPVDRPVSTDPAIHAKVTEDLRIVRAELRQAVYAALVAHTVVEGRTALQIVQAKGYASVDGYLYNNSVWAVTPNDIPLDAQALPALARRSQALNFDAELRRQRGIQQDKRVALGLKIYNANEYEIQAQALQARRPAVVDITQTIVGCPIGRSADV